MTKENESSQGDTFSGTSIVSAAAARFARHSTSSRRDSSPLSVAATRYRIVTDAPGPTEETPLHVTAQPAGIPTSPVGVLGVKPLAKNPRLMRRQATEKDSKGPVRFADLVRQASGKKVESDVDSNSAGGRSPSQRSKLPQKIRSSVSRMRSQLSLLTSNVGSNNAAISPDGKMKMHKGSGVSRSGSSPANAAVIGSTSPSSGARYSRQSQEISSKQAEKNLDRRASSMAAMRKSVQSQRSEHSINADGTTVFEFMELLRPLQSSMSSLRNADNDLGMSDSDDDDDDDEADALFRRHERESSRILRICCSLDNLLFSIADDVQENKHDVIAIASGPARKLVELILVGVNQIAEAMSATQVEDGMPSLTAKDERYLREFLVEIADRWSKLDDLLRGVFVSTIQRTRQELSELQVAHNELKEQKQTLELEMLELREFHSSENAATMAVTSNFMRLADHKQTKQKGPETEDDERLAEYDLQERGEKADGKKQTAGEEIEMLKAQCSEYGRLLEMAKQEIRLTHQEQQSQHARLVELSQSLLKDEEVAQLRNELQAEKKRVKMLEMEGLRMRECQMDLNLKIQSLQINQHGPGSTTKQSASKYSTVSTPQVLSQVGSVDSRRAATTSAPVDHASSPADDKVTVHAHTLCTSGSTEAQSSLVQGDLTGAHTDMAHVYRSSTKASSWLSRVLNSTVKTGSATAIDEDDGLVRLFLSNLLMTEQELDAAAAQAKLRKKSNVPTVGAPPRPATSSSAASPTKKKKKKKDASDPQDPNLVATTVEEWVSDTIVVTSVRQLIWTFYELYLMGEETRRVLCPQQVQWYRDSAPARCPPSFASYVAHYFLERHPSEEGALRNLRRFTTVLSKLRGEYGDVRLFCDFLEGSRGREEIHFLLWTLQAVDSVNLGVNYDDTTPVTMTPDSRQGRFVCTLKALYLTRMVFRLLHVKAQKKPTPASPSKGAVVKAKAASSAPAPVPTASSPKKRRKSRPLSAGAASTAVNQSSLIASPPVVDQAGIAAAESIIDRAKGMYSNAVNANSGFPLTLEAFNAIVLSFAVSPSQQELMDRLGAFYQPTGDERKISLDVFLVLLSETFATQLQWRRAQLQALFVRLAKEEEVEKMLAAKILQDELDAGAALAAAATAKKTRGQANEKPKKAATKTKKRERRVGIDKSPERHLKGLSRDRLRKFLVQGRIIDEANGVQQRDFDAVYVVILEISNETPSEIHFDQVYDALLRLELLGNDAFALDFSAWLADDAMGSQTISGTCSSAEGTIDRNQQIIDTWRALSVQTLAVTENDPNMFIRHVTRELMRRANSALAPYSRQKKRSLVSDTESVNAVQDCLRFAWSVVSRRVDVPTAGKSRTLESSLTEFFYLNQAIKVMISNDSHYASHIDLGVTRALPSTGEVDPLAVFYDCRYVNHQTGGELVAASRDIAVAKQDVQRVLQRYAMFIAHLFESYSLARCTSVNAAGGGLTRDQWLSMGRDIGLLNDQLQTVSSLEALFVASASRNSEGSVDSATTLTVNRSHLELVVDKPQFAALLVETTVQRYEASVQSKIERSMKLKHQATLPSLAQVVDRFCQCVIVPHAFHHHNRLQQEDFHRRLKCPLVTRVLLEHRAFLRQLFLHFAKCDDRDDDKETAPAVVGMRAIDEFDECRRVKTKRNSMAMPQFFSFLQEFQLHDTGTHSKTVTSLELRLDEVGTQRLFRAVMAIESDDTSCIEFDEFTTAVSAIAVLRKPNPFVRLHEKIDAFVGELRATHASRRDRDRQDRFGR